MVFLDNPEFMNDRNYYTDGSYVGTSRTFAVHIAVQRNIPCREADREFVRKLRDGEIWVCNRNGMPL